jgi:predicted transcriptional regulator
LFDEKAFRAMLKDKGKTLQDVADILSISLVTLYRKMNGESDFFRGEMDTLKKELNIENPDKIFFA